MKSKMWKQIGAMLLAGIMIMGTVAGCGTKEASQEAVGTADSGTKASDGEAAASADSGKEIKIAVLPKMKGENYWDACKEGAEEAIAELNEGNKVTLLYDGPPQDQSTNQKQVDILEGWIAQGVDAIVIGVVDTTAIAPTLQKAKEKGIKVVTYDSDTIPEARDLFVNQCSVDSVAKGLLDAAAEDLKAKGYGTDKPANMAIVAASKTETNHQAWLAKIKELLNTEEYSFIKINNEGTDLYYPGSDETQCQSQCATLISRMGEGEDKIQCAISFTSMGTPALASSYDAAADKPDKEKIVLSGLATPNALNSYIKDPENPMNRGVLWSCSDLGYLAVMTAYQLATNEISTDAAEVKTSRLQSSAIAEGGEVILGDVLIFDKDSVDNYNY